MAYTITKSNNTPFATITDGTINTDTVLTIIGKNYAGYGEFLGENFIRLLENSASGSSPVGALVGQLWYNTTAGLLTVWNGTTWKNLGAATAQALAPTSNVQGDMWFDTTNSQLKVWNGTAFTLIGPAFAASTGTSGAIVETIKDSVNADHIVIKLYSGNEVIAVASKDAPFTPQTTITGFTTPQINPGIQLADSISGQVPTFYGTAYNAGLLDNIDSTQFLRSDVADTTSGTLGVVNDGGLTVGATSNGSFYVATTNVYLKNSTANANLLLSVTNSVNGQVDVITVNGTTERAAVLDPLAANDIANKSYTDTQDTYYSGLAILRDGTHTLTGDLKPSTIGTINLGDLTYTYATVYATTFTGTATTALYADLAERFASDAIYAPGTVVELGGVAEVTLCNTDLSENVFGIVSTSPAYLMNSGAGPDATNPSIALSGRAPIIVTGTVTKGQRLVSAGNGMARGALAGEATAFNVIGRSLQDKLDSGVGTIEAFVSVK